MCGCTKSRSQPCFNIEGDDPHAHMAITPSQADYLYNYYGKKRKSVPREWLRENAMEVDRLAKPIRWNLRKLFDSKL